MKPAVFFNHLFTRKSNKIQDYYRFLFFLELDFSFIFVGEEM